MRKTIAFAFENINCDDFYKYICRLFICAAGRRIATIAARSAEYNSLSDIKSLYVIGITRRFKIL